MRLPPAARFTGEHPMTLIIIVERFAPPTAQNAPR